MPLAGWSYRREVTVDNTGGVTNAAKTNYAVKVALTNANFDFANAKADGTDIRFTSDDGETLLSFWRQDYDDAGETATFWVKAPSIGENTTVTIYIYYGNSGAADASSGADVFADGFIDFTDLSVLRGEVDDDGQIYLWNRLGISANPIVEVADIVDATSLREQDDIVHDPNDPNLGINPEREYKLYFSAIVSGANKIYVAFSEDGTYSNPTIQVTDIPDGHEDPSVTQLLNTRGQIYRDGDDKIYVYMESHDDDEIDVYSSVDGIAFTLVQDSVIAQGTAGAWDDTLTGSPVARHDGTNFIVGYEGIISTGEEAFGVADGTAAGTLTKKAANPLFQPADHTEASTSIVVDAFFKDDAGTAIYFLIHSGQTGATSFRAKTTNTDPTTWADLDIVEYGTGPIDSTITNDMTANNAQGLKQIVTTNIADTAIVLYDIGSASPEWYAARAGQNAEVANTYVSSGQLVMQPLATAPNHVMAVYSTGLAITQDISMMWRRKAEVQTDDLWTAVSIGSGDRIFVSTNRSATFNDSYQALVEDHDTAGGTKLREWAAGAFVADNVTGNTPAEAEFAVHELQLLSIGAITYLVDGAQIFQDTNESSHLAASKHVALVQGHGNVGGEGAISTYDWLAARPYDGEDPAQIVGAEEALAQNRGGRAVLLGLL